MADVAQIEFMFPADFTVGSDVYKGTETLQYNKQSGPVYNAIAEGDMQPTKQQQLRNERAPVTFTINSKSISVLNLQGTSAASATIEGVDALTDDDITVTITNPKFLNSGGGPSQTSPGTYSITGEATDIGFAASA